MGRISVILSFSQFIIIVTSVEDQRYFIPTQEHFVAQQTHQSLLHHKSHNPGFPPGQLFSGWPNPSPIGGHQVNLGGNVGAVSSASANANANAASGFSFGGFQQVGNPGGGGFQIQPPQQQGGGGLQFPQPQFFGGTFGLGFGFGGGWYNPYLTNSYPVLSGNIQHQHQQQPQQQPISQHQSSSASASASSSTGFQLNKPPINNNLQLPYPQIPYLLQPSQTGWDTSYNVPCGTYQIKPFVVANLRLGTASSPYSNTIGGGRRKRRSPFHFPRENRVSSNEEWFSGSRGQQSSQFEQRERGLPSFFPPQNPFINPVVPPGQPKTCSWTFHSDGSGCKLKFKCLWFQLPALVSCSENYMIVSDTTPHLNNTFCGPRKPRKVYNSSNGKLILTFRSQTASLPAVFDCAVTCSLESSNGAQKKPQSHEKLILTSLTKDDNNFTTSTENDSTFSSTSTLEKDSAKVVGILGSTSASSATGGVTLKPRLRIGDCRCGVQDDHYLTKGRIVGGSPTTPGENSWVVALVRKSSSGVSGGGRPFCSGSLISDRYAITAAHCVSNNKIIREPRSFFSEGGHSAKELFDILLIEHDVTRLDDIPGGSLRSSVDKIIVHPRYNNVTFDFDVALIRLEHPIQFTNRPDFYRYDTFDFHSRRRFIPEVEARPKLPRPIPVCLPSDKAEVLAEKYATVTGWGLTEEGGNPSNELLKATVQIFNDSACKEIYKEYNYPVTDTMICAGYMAGKVDACVGDSGGGLIVKENEKYTLAGITSWGRGCGREKQPGVYTRVPALLDWIQTEASDGIWCI